MKKIIECSGALVYATATGRFLLLQKATGKHANRWGLVGGTNNDGETAWQGLLREIEEEIGMLPDIKKTFPLEKFVSADSNFNFSTYFCIVEFEFLPQLSSEHIAWGWFNLSALPKPLHKGLDLSLHDDIIRTKIQTIVEIIKEL